MVAPLPALGDALLPRGRLPAQPLAARAVRRLGDRARDLVGVLPAARRRARAALARAALRGHHLPAAGGDALRPAAGARAARQAVAQGRPRDRAPDPVRPLAVRALRQGRHPHRDRDAAGQHRGRGLLRRDRARLRPARRRGGRRGRQGDARGAADGAPAGQPAHAHLRGPARRGGRRQAQRPPLRQHPVEPADHARLRRARRRDRPHALRERRPQPAVPARGRPAARPPRGDRDGARRHDRHRLHRDDARARAGRARRASTPTASPRRKTRATTSTATPVSEPGCRRTASAPAAR